MRQATAGDVGLVPPTEGLPIICMLRGEFEALPEYSCTLPTGVVPGKRWRRHDGAHDHRQRGRPHPWLVCEYSEPFMDGGEVYCSVLVYRPVLSREATASDLGLEDFS